MTGRVAAIAIRTSKQGPMREIARAEATVDAGIAGDIPVKPERGITFISAEQWRDVEAALERPLAWHTRRANVLVEGLPLADLIGRTIRCGAVSVHVLKETKPCVLMDILQPGLKPALQPECRGGVHGRVLSSGAFAVGDAIEVIE